MATAEELLRGVTGVDKTLYIDFDTREITIPPNIHQLGVESDDDVKKLTFNVPRYYYDNDLSEFNIYINYMNANKEGDLFEVFSKDVTIGEDDTLSFNWLVGRNAVAYKGTAIFNVCMKKIQKDAEGNIVLDDNKMPIVEKEFNTTIAKLPVLEGLETGEVVVQEYADILLQWESMLFGAGDTIEAGIVASGEEQRRQIDLKGSEVNNTVTATGEAQKTAIVQKGNEVINTIDTRKTEIETAASQGISDINAVKDSVTAEGEAQKTAIIQKGNEVVQTIDTRKTEIETAATKGISDINAVKDSVTAEGEAQKTAIIQKGSEVVQTVTETGGTQIANIEAKGTEVTNSLNETLPTLVTEYMVANPAATHSWNGTVLTMTTTGGGTSSSDLKGEKGDKGDPGTSVTILGSYSTEAELIAAHPTGNAGDSYLVNGDLYVWSEINSAWENIGTIQGPAGYTPQKGVDYTDGTDGVSPTISVSKSGKVTTVTITDATGPHEFTINDGVDGTGSGDMVKTTYDADNDGVVDNAAALGGKAASEYALKNSLTATNDGNGNITVSLGG